MPPAEPSLSSSNEERAGVPASPKPGEGGRCRKFYFDGGQVKIAAEIVHELNAVGADPFDLLWHLAFNAPVLIMRKDKEREAERLKADMKDKGLNGNLDRPPMLWLSSVLTGRGDCLVVPFPGPPLRVSPGFNMSGFQPGNLSGPKACHVTAWAGASIASGGPGQPSSQISQAL